MPGRSPAAVRSGGTLQTQGAPLIGEARREIHEARDAISAREAPRASGVDEDRIEEGERQRLADRALAAIVAGGKFGDVGYRPFDEAIEP